MRKHVFIEIENVKQPLHVSFKNSSLSNYNFVFNINKLGAHGIDVLSTFSSLKNKFTIVSKNKLQEEKTYLWVFYHLVTG